MNPVIKTIFNATVAVASVSLIIITLRRAGTAFKLAEAEDAWRIFPEQQCLAAG